LTGEQGGTSGGVSRVRRGRLHHRRGAARRRRTVHL